MAIALSRACHHEEGVADALPGRIETRSGHCRLEGHLDCQPHGRGLLTGRRRRGEQMSRADFRRWRLAAFSVAATAAALTAAGSLTPALAATGPSMTANHGSVNIAVPGPNHSLRFYWAVNGTTTWHAETVAGPGSTFSAPSMTVNGNSVNIAAAGSLARLKFYWAVNGTSTWHPETVAGPGSTFSAPSMTVNGNSVNIAAAGSLARLKFYWAINGTSTWHPETVAGPGSVR
jgi:hypothetical protein